jgi:hypothetical protein
MWDGVTSRKHTVTKVFPARFQELPPPDDDGSVPRGVEQELMLFGDVHRVLDDGSEVRVPWATHAVVRKVTEGERHEWKLAQYRVWLQN